MSLRVNMRRMVNAPGLLLLALLCAVPAWGEQNYVSRYDLFAGYTFLDSPHVGLSISIRSPQGSGRPQTAPAPEVCSEGIPTRGCALKLRRFST